MAEPQSNGRALAELLEKAYATPATFADQVLPRIRQNVPEAVPVLLSAFDGSNAVAKGLVADLFRGPLKEFAPGALLGQLDERHPDRFIQAAQILADLRHAPAVEPLIRALSARAIPVAVASLKALMTFATPAAFQALTELLLTCPDEVKLAAAERVLAPAADILSPELLKRYDALDTARKAWILKFLAEAGAVQALPRFVAALEQDPLGVGLYGVKGLGCVGTAEAIAVLDKHLAHPEWFLRKRIVEALGQAKAPNAVASLVRALADPSVQVRSGAIEALSKVGHLDIPLLIDRLEKGDRDLKVHLIRVMGQVRDRRLLEPMVRTLADRSMLVFSLDALGDLGFAEAAGPIERFLTDKEWFNRLNAIEALGKLPLPNLYAIAERLLEDENDMVRNSARRIMAKTARA
ncbi:MAG TPA: HEAT repeat domain-containing protein [Candidatus Ozemobacteraceae bacterium]|nr:HEAT repeat domain-containing protein [Candidatus Ozemobacteraceae bacterium]